MGLAEAKNDIKTLFLVLNTICSLLAGVYWVTIGVARSVVTAYNDNASLMAVDISISLVVGLLLLGLAVLGYVGAVLEHRIVLIVYAVAMTLFVTIHVIAKGVLVTRALASYFGPEAEMIQPISFTLSHAVISLVSVSLAGVLANQARRQVSPRYQGCVLSPPRPTGPLLSA